MDDNLTIECVWYQSKRDFNKFVRAIEDESACVIDYQIIKNKLVKADPYSEEPNDSVVGVNIISMIKSTLDPELEKTTHTIVYSFKNLNHETVTNFKDLIEKLTSRKKVMILNVLNMEKVPNKKILNKFDFVKFIDND